MPLIDDVAAARDAYDRMVSDFSIKLNDASKYQSQARAAVDGLTKDGLTSMVALQAPPPAIALVTRAVLIMLGKQCEWEDSEQTWKSSQHLILDVDGFVAALKDVGPECLGNVSDPKLQAILAMPEFTPEQVAPLSADASNLCKWLINTVDYLKVWEQTAPMQAAMMEARAAVDRAQAALAAQGQQ